jgi:hypothetical protein
VSALEELAGVELRCSGCQQYKPALDFHRKNATRFQHRYGRCWECKACAAARGRRKRAAEAARRALPVDVAVCSAANCGHAATEQLTNGKFLNFVALSLAGGRLMRNGGSAPMCHDCYAKATGA